MKVFFICMIFILPFTKLLSQRAECGTLPKSGIVHQNTLVPLPNRVNYTTPYPVRIFIHVFAKDDGTERAVEDTTVMRQVTNMVNFYAPQNICFIVAGIEQINNTDLWDMWDGDWGLLNQYLEPGCIDIFIHNALFTFDDFNNLIDLNGTAYDIPNHFLSLSKTAVQSVDNLSTMAHEMGHCFGLYHTFQERVDANNNIIREKVNRTGACSNCSTEGDLLCDTEADLDIPYYNFDPVTRLYTGSAQDSCNNPYVMAPDNIMTYGRRSCRNHFTNEQGSRARTFLISTPFLEECISEDVLLITTNQVISSGHHIFTARNTLTIDAGAYTCNGFIEANYSGREITVKPGATFSPTGASAYIRITAGSFCQ